MICQSPQAQRPSGGYSLRARLKIAGNAPLYFDFSQNSEQQQKIQQGKNSILFRKNQLLHRKKTIFPIRK